VAQLVWTAPALEDLDEIAEYIALDNSEAAKKLVQSVFDVVSRLSEFPDSGRRPPELSRSRYREVIVGPCRIFYRHTNKKVFILYVMRSERQLRNFILSDRESRG
jgi:toxin ParE1/3/4